MKQRVFCILLVVMMILTSVDITAFAQPVVETVTTEANEEETSETESVQSEETETVSTSAVESEEESVILEESTEAVSESGEEETEITSSVEESTVTSETLAESVAVVEETTVENVIDVLAEGNISRIEWLQALVSTFDMTVEADNYPDNYYSDIDSTYEYYHDLMVATEFGLVDVEAGDAFNPDEVATRAFAAHSLNICLGYVPDSGEYSFSESGEVDYPDDIEIAIQRSWFALSNGAFLPDQAITESEKQIMIADAEAAIADTTIDTEYQNTYELKDNVIVLPEDVDAHMTDENELTIYNCTQSLETGDIFAIVTDGFPAVKKVKSITAIEGGIIIQTESVETEEAFESIDMQGQLQGNLADIQAVGTDVTLNYIVGGTAEENWEDGTKYETVESVGNQQISAVEVIKSYEIPEDVKAEYEIADGVTADISCKVTNAYADYSATSKSAYFNVGATTAFTCNVSLDVLEAIGAESSITLVKVPVAYVAYMSVKLDLTLKGSVTLSFVESFSAGVYASKDEGFRFVHHFNKQSFTIQAKAEASVGIKASIGIDAIVVKGSVYAKIGAKALMESEVYTDGNLPASCTHVQAYLYASIGCEASVNVLLYKDKWGKSIDFYKFSNSPVKVAQHYEDGKPVARCTRESSGGDGAGSGTSRWKYYTPADSRYGYNGASSGIGSNGEPFTIFDYTLDADNNATITGYHGNVSALNIPETLDGYTVVGIASDVFKGNVQLRMVILPDSIETIGKCAFSDCKNLASVTLSKGLTSMGYYVFSECDALTEIEIPKSLKSTSRQWFSENVIGFPGCVGIFAGCDNLKKITFEAGVTEIASHLFANCPGIEEVEIPDTVTIIEEFAFYQCENLEEIVIPDSVTVIETFTFYNCRNLKNVIVT